MRLMMFVAMAAFLVAALCVPDAFEDLGLLLAGAYAVVRVAHIVLFALAARGNPALRRLVTGLAVGMVPGVGLLLAAAFADDPLHLVPAVALLGGSALYLAAHIAFRLRTVHSLNVARLVCALACLALIAAAVYMPALATLGILAALLAALIAYEALRYAEARDRIRHQLTTEQQEDAAAPAR